METMKNSIAGVCLVFLVLLEIDMTTSLIRRDLSIHMGKNLTIPCDNSKDENSILWSRNGNNITYNVNVSAAR